MKKLRFALPCLLLGLLTTGCGSNMLRAKGRVVKGGQPFVLPADQSMRVIFAPTEKQAERYESYAAMFNPKDGTFQVVGKDGNGLPPGRYRVSLELLKKKNDLFKGAYSVSNTPFVFDVNGSTGEVLIDLDKGGPKEDNEPKPDSKDKG